MVWASWGAMAQNQPWFDNGVFAFYQQKLVEASHHAQARADNALTSTFEHREWLQKSTATNWPTFSCGVQMSNTLYNMTVEELSALVKSDSLWSNSTRELCYSALLATEMMSPEVTKNSLMKRVNCWRVIQDGGIGGAWPVNTDRVVWVIAAWQHYLATGDKVWLKQVYDVTRSTLMQDEASVYDSKTGLVRGAASMMDWHEDYPEWMTAADIAMTECLSTNALYFRVNEIAARLATLLGDKAAADKYTMRAETIKTGINKYLWLEDKGYYSQFLYGRGHQIASQRSETLGEALCIIFGIADQAKARRMMTTVAQTTYGTPCYSPQSPNGMTYHNNAVWPVVEAYWMWASAVAGNQQSVVHSMASIYRVAALFANNQECIDATHGTLNTAHNGKSQLMSVAANLSVAQKILMGLHYEEQGLAIRPFVPRDWSNSKTMVVKYRKSVLEIEVQGCGDNVVGCYIDGKSQKSAIVPNSLTGKHKVRVVLDGTFKNLDRGQYSPVVVAPATVKDAWLDSTMMLAWTPVPNAKEYKIMFNGEQLSLQPGGRLHNQMQIDGLNKIGVLQVIAVDSNGVESFASEPVELTDNRYEQCVDMSRIASASTSVGTTGGGAIELGWNTNTQVSVEVNIEKNGWYGISFRYANGNGRKYTGNSCASRQIYVQTGDKSELAGTAIFPNLGNQTWDKYGTSNQVMIYLKAGKHTITLSMDPENDNMAERSKDKVLLDSMRLVLLSTTR